MAKKCEWIVAIANTEGDGVTLRKVTGTADDIATYLLGIISEDKENDAEGFVSGSKNESDIDRSVDFGSNEVIELNGYNTFSDYHIDYTARRIDEISTCTLS